MYTLYGVLQYLSIEAVDSRPLVTLEGDVESPTSLKIVGRLVSVVGTAVLCVGHVSSGMPEQCCNYEDPAWLVLRLAGGTATMAMALFSLPETKPAQQPCTMAPSVILTCGVGNCAYGEPLRSVWG